MMNQKYFFIHLDSSLGIDQQRDLLLRLNLYGEELYSLTKMNLTVILGRSKHFDISPSGENYKYLNIYFVKKIKRNFLLGAYRLRKIVGFESDAKRVMIASNFSVDFMPLLVLKSRYKFKTQISIHGYYSKFSPFFVFLQIFAKYADSVRTVSETLSDFVIQNFKVKESSMIIAPIPIGVPDLDYDASIEYDILFLGRLHKERNIEEWISIVKEVSGRLKSLKVAIAGDGELRSIFESSLSEFEGKLQFDFLGYIPHSEISSVLSSSRILLSTARSESYGLSIREAQLLGVKVLARRSEGSQEAAKLLDNSIIIYDDASYAAEEITQILMSERWPNFDVVEKFRKLVAEQNQSNVSNLVKSWHALI